MVWNPLIENFFKLLLPKGSSNFVRIFRSHSKCKIILNSTLIHTIIHILGVYGFVSLAVILRLNQTMYSCTCNTNFTQLVNSRWLHTAADEEEPFTSVQPPLSSSPSLVFNLLVFFSLIFFFGLPLSSGPFSLHRKRTV